MTILGLELTFIPIRANKDGAHEFTKAQAEHAVKALARRLRPINKAFATFDTQFLAKVEPFRRDWLGGFSSYIVEVVHGSYPPELSSFNNKVFLGLVHKVFKAAKDTGLVPRIIKREGDTEVYVPSGGIHIHWGIAGLFHSNYLTNLASFERHLYLDFANRPYIRWLFSEWFDEETNSMVGWRPKDPYSPRRNVSSIWEYGQKHQHAIMPRFSDLTDKAILPTYEFRVFDEMVADTRELALIIRFLDAWVESIRDKVLKKERPVVTINPKRFNDLRNIRYAWREISSFLKRLGLRPSDYRPWFERCYVPRVRYGKMT